MDLSRAAVSLEDLLAGKECTDDFNLAFRSLSYCSNLDDFDELYSIVNEDYFLIVTK